MTRLALAAPIALLALTASTPTGAATDFKAMPGGACTPYAPDTTVAELQFSPTGIYNPGTGIEKVFCPLPRDQDSAYSAGNLGITVHYRVLSAVAQRMTCTLWIGSLSIDAGPVVSSTQSGPYAAGGNREEIYFVGGAQENTTTVVPTSLVCAIPPKTSFGGVFQSEAGATSGP